MKPLIIGLVLFSLPLFALADFQTNLSYGSTGSDVNALQEFLVSQHLLAPQYVTGNFYSLTLAAVKAFQSAESVTPVSGYFGPITRATANTILASEAPQSEGNASTTTEPVDLSQGTTTPTYMPSQVAYVPVYTQSNSSPTFGSVQSGDMADTQTSQDCTPTLVATISKSELPVPNQWDNTSYTNFVVSGTYSIPAGCTLDPTITYSISRPDISQGPANGIYQHGTLQSSFYSWSTNKGKPFPTNSFTVSQGFVNNLDVDLQVGYIGTIMVTIGSLTQSVNYSIVEATSTEQ